MSFLLKFLLRWATKFFMQYLFSILRDNHIFFFFWCISMMNYTGGVPNLSTPWNSVSLSSSSLLMCFWALFVAVLVSSGCCNKMPKAGWLIQQTCFLPYWRLESPISTCWLIQCQGRALFLQTVAPLQDHHLVERERAVWHLL